MSKKIELTQGKFAVVDDEDFDRVNAYKWYAAKQKYTFYAARGVLKDGVKKTIFLHNFIINSNNIIDHKDRDGLNCTKDNLRECNKSQNGQNKIGRNKYKGVSKTSDMWRIKKWVARIKKPNGKYEHIGHFLTEEEAAYAYDKKAAEYFGDFALFNFPRIIR